MEEKKTCFVVTPIGNDDSDIRRHIDGIIDQAIVPALGEKYIIDVAHRKYEIGSINDRVIESVYKSDLVIANLTNLNPNVMFELAIRYSFGKPAIVIAEKGTNLPFDVIVENTVFYINDPAGANELKEKIIEFESNIDYTKINYGPVFKIINRIPLYSEVEGGKDISSDKAMSYIINRLDSIEQKLERPIKKPTPIKKERNRSFGLAFLQPFNDCYKYEDEFVRILGKYNEYILKYSYNSLGFEIIFDGLVEYERFLDLKKEIQHFIKNSGLPDHDLRFSIS